MIFIIKKGKKLIQYVETRKKWLNEKIIKIEENSSKNETRKCFEEVKNFKCQQSVSPMICKSANGNIQMQPSEVLDRWKEHFQTLLNINKLLMKQK